MHTHTVLARAYTVIVEISQTGCTADILFVSIFLVGLFMMYKTVKSLGGYHQVK